MIRNTEADKHWLKEEEEGGDSSDDKEPEGSEAGQETARKEGKILMNLVAVVKLKTTQVKLKFAVQNTLVLILKKIDVISGKGSQKPEKLRLFPQNHNNLGGI